MKAAVITVGTELLIGSILNTNSKYVSQKLTDLGVDVSKQVTVDDNMNDIIDELTFISKKCDLILLTGGLGPTNDDITRESLAKFLGRKIYLDEEEKLLLEERYRNNKQVMPENNYKQVCLIEGSNKLKNNWGAALGEWIIQDDVTYIVMPGPPGEFEPMVDAYLPKIVKSEENIIIKSLDVIGLGEARVERMIRALNIENDNVSINTFAHQGYTEIKIIGKSNDFSFVSKSIEVVEETLYSEFRDHIYSDKNLEISNVLVEKLTQNNLTIAFAESITGGKLASSITDVAGSSKVISSSYVTYSNDSKHMNLNVKRKTLDEYGAVSRQTAYEMAKGLKEKTGADICVSTTGEAGPIPAEKEVGTVYSCIYFNDDKYFTKEYFFNGDRDKIRNRTVNSVLSQILFLVNRKEYMDERN
ncbi:competence/damage-inducible protein A [Peptoniphilus sp.]|jgi:nicotinamide-nucleotide amidase|uniref:competence/damage-inducible protein A n=1 Tax=Peptoniphilus sp. TaxID=1971214 RepID=UPI003D90BBF2